MPYSRSVTVKRPGQHLGQREIRAQRLLRHLEAALLQPLAEERQVPGFELAPREFLEIRELAARGRAAAPRQIVEEPEHLLAALRHARGQRIVGEVRIAQQQRKLVAQRQDFVDDRVVVEAARGRPELGGPRDPGLVDVAPQLLALGAGHDGHVGRLIELEQPAAATRLRAHRRPRDRARSPASPASSDSSVTCAVIGARGIEHVLGEFGRKVRQPLHHLAVALFAIGRQIDAGETEIAQGVLQHLALCRIEAVAPSVRCTCA